MEIATLSTAFTLGIFSSLHCLGMCGGIAGALSLASQGGGVDRKWRLAAFSLAYNAGRIASYCVAGAALATIGARLPDVIGPEYGNILLRGLAALVVVGIGLHLGGWFPTLSRIEWVGRGVWRVIEPLGRYLLPARTPIHALAYGAVWGWLPCGLVYSTLIWAGSSGSGWDGSLIMLLFGLGTLPVMISTSFFARSVIDMARKRWVRQVAGSLVIVVGLVSLLYTGSLIGQNCTACSVN